MKPSDAPAVSPRSAAALLFLYAQTALHPGSGTALGVVDLPVQRERHTQWPTIPGSALKGVLRDACREKAKENYQDEYENQALKRTRRQVANEDDPLLVAAFGPGKVEESSSHAGAISLTDARILAFPVRSLKGVFAWVTCRAVLDRLQRDLTLHNGLAAANRLKLPAAPAEGKALAETGPLLVDGNKLVLEEFEFERADATAGVADWVSTRAVADAATQERLKTHLVILSDDEFTHFVRHATEVVARVGLDYERKTVRSGALFYQECLPAETLFYSVVLANPSRRAETPRNAADLLKWVREHLPPILQIGGDETIGKGLCAVRLWPETEDVK